MRRFNLAAWAAAFFVSVLWLTSAFGAEPHWVVPLNATTPYGVSVSHYDVWRVYPRCNYREKGPVKEKLKFCAWLHRSETIQLRVLVHDDQTLPASALVPLLAEAQYAAQVATTRDEVMRGAIRVTGQVDYETARPILQEAISRPELFRHELIGPTVVPMTIDGATVDTFRYFIRIGIEHQGDPFGIRLLDSYYAYVPLTTSYGEVLLSISHGGDVPTKDRATVHEGFRRNVDVLLNGIRFTRPAATRAPAASVRAGTAFRTEPETVSLP